jgi:predicted nucleic acid-binding protein
MNSESLLAKEVYADANFLISYWLPKHEDYEQARLRFFELIENNFQIALSPLVIDESWYKIYKIWESQNPSIQKPFHEFYQNFKELLDFIISSQFLKIIQFRNDLVNGCRQALENIKTYNFRPHDAFHLAMMEDSQISTIVTKDSHFTKQSNKRKLEEKGIKVISF